MTTLYKHMDDLQTGLALLKTIYRQVTGENMTLTEALESAPMKRELDRSAHEIASGMLQDEIRQDSDYFHEFTNITEFSAYAANWHVADIIGGAIRELGKEIKFQRS